MSMYFAGVLKTTIVATNEPTWNMLVLVGVFALQMRFEGHFEAWCVRNKDKQFFWEVMLQVSFLVSRTVAFLLLNLLIHETSVLGSAAPVLWAQKYTLPILLILLMNMVVTNSHRCTVSTDENKR